MTLSKRRVHITGMGAVSALGLGVDALWNASRSGQTGVRTIVLPRTEKQQVTTAAHYSDFDPAPLLPKPLLDTDRFVQFALVAADEAMRQAQWTDGEPCGDRTAVIIGSGIGGATASDLGHYKYYVTGERVDPMTVPKVMPNAAASHIAMRYGARGPSFAVSSACSSSTQAIGLGLMLIRSGAVDRAIVGGSEAMLTPATFRAWETLRVMTPTLCRPFSKGRNGMVLGEGAAVFLLEAEDVARAGVKPIAEMCGYGTSSDASDIVRPDAQGASRSIMLALADADVHAADIGYINAHGTGTILNDVTETEAVRMVFGDGAHMPALSSTKPVHGHALGAAGAIELVVTVSALRDGVVPPTLNWLEPDPRCISDPVANTARTVTMRHALTNSFAFGGINASLIVGKVA